MYHSVKTCNCRTTTPAEQSSYQTDLDMNALLHMYDIYFRQISHEYCNPAVVILGVGGNREIHWMDMVSRRGRSLWLLSKKWREMGDSGGCDDVEVPERSLRLGIVCSFHRFLGGPAPGRPHTMPCAFHCMVANVSKALFCSVVNKKSAIFSGRCTVSKWIWRLKGNVSNEKRPGCLRYIGDYTTQSQLYWDCNNHYKDPYEPTSILKRKNVFFRGWCGTLVTMQGTLATFQWLIR